MPVALAGTGRIADELYLLAHDDVTGKPLLQSRALGLGLAGALLAELVLEGKILIRPGEVVVAGFAACQDELTQRVMDLVLSEFEGHPLRDWLAFFAVTARQKVARRLEASGYLTQVSSRWPRRPGRWVPVDSDSAFAPMIRVRAVLEPTRTRTATASDALLAGLAAACGLGPRILPYGPPDALHRLEAAVRQLHPDLRELISHTQAAVDSALLTHRM
jgi:Golgi phosphoprotein 3 (GPP34)